MIRPEFDNIQTFEEFNKYYWYRDELIEICKLHGLKSTGTKMELYEVIKSYFSGTNILPEPRKQKTRKSIDLNEEINLETGIIEGGFTFGKRYRDFFIKETGNEKFKFNVDMVATVKSVKENNDESFTVGDLLDIYYGNKSYAVYNKSMLQWNKFVKNFCTDESTKIFKQRLKAASILWKLVRESDKIKEYSHELFEENKDYILSELFKT